jgi:hypothetical protein
MSEDTAKHNRKMIRNAQRKADDFRRAARLIVGLPGQAL